MVIDPVTFVAQIVNFVVLVALLTRFLYRPLMAAVDERERALHDRECVAEAACQSALRQEGELAARLTTLDAERTAVLRQARERADQEFALLLAGAQREVQRLDADWREEARMRHEALLADAQLLVGRHVLLAARSVLRDLSDESLEARIVDVFLRRLSTLDEDARSRLWCAANGPVRVVTCFSLDARRRDEVVRALKDSAGRALVVRFEDAPARTAGIEVRVGPCHLEWSIDAVIRATSDDLSRSLGQASRESTDRDSWRDGVS